MEILNTAHREEIVEEKRMNMEWVFQPEGDATSTSRRDAQIPEKIPMCQTHQMLLSRAQLNFT